VDMNKVYGLWLGTGWLKTNCGQVVQSHSPNGIRAHMLDAHTSYVGCEVREIGEDGKPVEAKAVRPQSNKMIRPDQDK